MQSIFPRSLRTYQGKTPQIDADAAQPGTHAPALPDAAGRQVGAAALHLAEEIEGLYVYDDYARTFNVPTNLDT